MTIAKYGIKRFKVECFSSLQQFAEYHPDLQIEPYGFMQHSEDFNGEIPLSCKPSTIKVTGLPERATEDLLTNYFENAKRSKGGPVSNVVIKPDSQTCEVTFESPDGRFDYIRFQCTCPACYIVGRFSKDNSSSDEKAKLR